ncbi:NAD(P)H-binding protein [Actinoplanes sp. TBRC 11911]|uniref:NAD-dependent epimerase/dehydratase family protein n=1 Tax=Actinoplanes sp. TBRC 11911 TaxID=2729386 RepID=UPI00145D1847|nr:NAD(P)H-binding protein [Actinoplanes sp. TBRC 11911]NMO57572.1 NAD(P)H-binding protein [Actinoplanes sp. TBRC 11911]
MRILVAGASGLLGTHITRTLRERGHEVTTLARRSNADHSVDLHQPTDLRPLLAGHDGVVVALRTEEQRPLPKPIYPAFRHDLVDPVVRLMTAARQEGLTRAVLMGSYYTYFDRLHPEWQLSDRHMYVRCRAEQAREGRDAAGPGLPLAVLELPFVLGRANGRLPNWAGPLQTWAKSRSPLLAPPGGTAVTSATVVAETAADALEKASNENIPVADENVTWHEMFTRMAAAAGHPRRVRRLPAAVARAALRSGAVLQAATRKETGVSLDFAADLFLTDLFVEPVSGRSMTPAFAETFH